MHDASAVISFYLPTQYTISYPRIPRLWLTYIELIITVHFPFQCIHTKQVKPHDGNISPPKIASQTSHIVQNTKKKTNEFINIHFHCTKTSTSTWTRKNSHFIGKPGATIQSSLRSHLPHSNPNLVHSLDFAILL